jgi:hypothetical protein
MKLPSVPLACISKALIFPDRTFAEKKTYQSSIPLLLMLLFLLFIIGERMTFGYYQNPYVRILAVTEAEDLVERIMAPAPDEAKAEARARIAENLIGNGNPILNAMSITLSSLVFILIVLEVWVLASILSQFFGGQEQKLEGAKPSLFLAAYASIPLALRKLLEGIVMMLKDPRVASNALTLEAFRELSSVKFSLLAVFPLIGAGDWVRNLLDALTDPFFLWTALILAFGSKDVFKIPLKNAITLAGILILLLAVQNHLLRSLGLQLGVLV